MYRKKIEELKAWYNKPKRKPLIVWGARQVGKSYLITEIFLSDFIDYVYIDLKKDEDSRNYFSTTCNPEKYLEYIERKFNKVISNECPLIFDEVQECHNVLTSLKYFNQDYPNLPVIATGSLVRLSLENEDENFLFPVGKVDSITLYPLTFEEFLINTNPSIYKRIQEAFLNNKPLFDYEHNLAMDLLHEYLSIGGMPEIIQDYIEKKSYVSANNLRKELYENYLQDMQSYNLSYATILKTINVYKNIYSQLNKENKNFKVTMVEKGKSNRDYFNAYKWLELAKVVYKSEKKEGKVELPLVGKDDSLFRLYLSDCGIFTYQSNVDANIFFAKNLRSNLSGIFFENYVADQFIANDIPLFYWTGKDNYEFEFIVENNGFIVPIDVKKGSGKLNSLINFRTHNPKYVAVKISSNNYGYDKENMILTVPLYSVFMLIRDLKNNSSLVKSK